ELRDIRPTLHCHARELKVPTSHFFAPLPLPLGTWGTRDPHAPRSPSGSLPDPGRAPPRPSGSAWRNSKVFEVCSQMSQYRKPPPGGVRSLSQTARMFPNGRPALWEDSSGKRPAGPLAHPYIAKCQIVPKGTACVAPGRG
ncbi:hypothetical protein GOODEAATRI_030616, partial [Goodea atripinnis]